MRKKLLRSRTGFEKPESREEAIMQNILGASNVLEPSESNIEEILKSILYNTPYTKEAEFEIEKILLAIKNNGTYDGEGESRDMKILIAILNDLDYTEEAESRIEELFIEWLHQRSSIKVLEGVPPLTFTSRGLPLINYLIEGNTIQNGTPTPDNPIMPEGTGERTGNLFDPNGVTTNERGETRVGVELPAGAYCITNLSNAACYWRIGVETQTGNQINSSAPYVYINAPDTLVVWVGGNSNKNIMLNLGSTPLPYEPYGYKIPISLSGTTNNVYLGEVQTTRRIKKLAFDGTENVDLNSVDKNRLIVQAVYTLPKSGTTTATNIICSHLKTLGSGSATSLEQGIAMRYNGTDILFGVPFSLIGATAEDTNATIRTKLKSYLTAQYTNGTPVTVWYVLATEETGIVNEPLMRIGDYADTLSMEQAGVEIPTASGSNTLDVDTTVKPSNVYIEYK